MIFSGVEDIPKHILVVILVSCRVDLLRFARSSVFPREPGTSLCHRVMSNRAIKIHTNPYILTLMWSARLSGAGFATNKFGNILSV